MNKSEARGFAPMNEWKAIPWRKLERKVYKLQKRIYRASQRGDVKIVRRLQKMLMKSWAAKCLAVRRISQDNQGKKTAGVDGVKSLTPKQRLNLVDNLKLGTKAKPTRRVWIPKPGKEEKRPLGIPTMYDRALQALAKLALEPEWEAQFEPNSYGFRPGRSCQDAIAQIHIALGKKAKYVLDADISKCFDCIDHKALLRKLNTSPTIRRQIKAWLEAGVMDNEQLFPTSEGTPQGGVISPLLANIALHGMEERIKQAFPRRKIGCKENGSQINSAVPDVIRYADDFVILHEDLTVVQRCREIISEWLKNMSLELKPSKTRLTHTLERHEENEPGFNFLGFNVRQFPAGKYTSGKDRYGTQYGFSTIITPSHEKVKAHTARIGNIIKAHKSVPQAALIRHLNPVIRGWANYYSTAASSRTYKELDRQVYQQLRAWATFRHPNKTGGWKANKYWQTIGGNNWVFATRQEGTNPLRLQTHSQTKIIRPYAKVKGESSPYDGNLVYWSARLGNNPEMPMKVSKLLKKQKGKCTICELIFRENDVLEVDHIIPKSQGGKDTQENKQLIHRHCHDTKTAYDGSTGTKSGCNSAEPKPSKRLERVMDIWVMRYA